jgi:hypothetical protein
VRIFWADGNFYFKKKRFFFLTYVFLKKNINFIFLNENFQFLIFFLIKWIYIYCLSVYDFIRSRLKIVQIFWADGNFYLKKKRFFF